MTQPVGEKLKHTREEQRITLEDASEATHIRVPFLQALEASDLSVLPSPVQARGFLRNYAEYLGLNIDQILAEVEAEQEPLDEVVGPADLTSQADIQTPEPLFPQEATSPSSFEADSPSPIVESQPEPVLDEQPESDPVTESQGDPQADINESLWQTWLNRIGSVVSSRNTSSTLQSEDASDDVGPDDDTSELESSQPQESESANISEAESTKIFEEIGVELRERRELLSLHLDEVERNTHVKAHYLEALEKGAMNDLPSTVQTRGMLSNYATFLDLDVDALLLRYADALQARHREKNPHKPVRKPGQPIVANLPPMRSFIAGDMVFGVGIAILLIGFCIWGINQVITLQGQEGVQPTSPSISEILLATPDSAQATPTETLIPAESLIQVTETIVIPTQNINVNVQVNLVAVERTFMRVLVDGKEVFNGRVVPGNAYPFEAETQIEVLVGSGAAIRIVYNGRDLGLLGGLGQVADNIYLADEIITPTAEPTLTPTNTVQPTSTSLPTLTPAPSDTPVPTDTPAP